MNRNMNTSIYVPESTKELLSCLSDPNVKKFLSLLSNADVNLMDVAKEYSKPSASKSNPSFDAHGRKTGLKSDGKPIPHTADPIKDINVIKRIQEYFITQTSVRDYALFTLGICFGLRIGDLLSLHFYDIMDSKETYKKYIQIHEDKTNKLNKIAITDLAIKTIQKYIEYLNVTEGGFRLNDYIFRSRKPRQTNDSYEEEGQSPLTPARVHQIFKKAAKDLNLNFNFSTHTLRKTFSYWSIKLNEGNTETLYTLQAALNHSDTRTTLKYAGITQDNVDKIRNDVSSFIENSDTECSKVIIDNNSTYVDSSYIPEATSDQTCIDHDEDILLNEDDLISKIDDIDLDDECIDEDDYSFSMLLQDELDRIDSLFEEREQELFNLMDI